MKLNLILVFVLCLFTASCKKNASPEAYNAKANDPQYLHNAEEKMTEVIVHDIFSPPVAARIYAYANIAAYEALVAGQKDYLSQIGRASCRERV